MKSSTVKQVSASAEEIAEVGRMFNYDPQYIKRWMNRHGFSLLEVSGILALMQDFTESGRMYVKDRVTGEKDDKWLTVSMSFRTMARCYELVERDFDALESLAELVLECPAWESTGGLPQASLSSRHRMLLNACEWYSDPQYQQERDRIEELLRNGSVRGTSKRR